jgi:hypothetical protein
MKQLLSLCAIGLVAVMAAPRAAHAGAVDVQVGYADNLRPSPFFPNPFNNGLTSPGSYVLGGHTVNYLGGGSSIDAGAFRLINTGGADVTINQGLHVDGFANGAADFQIWDSIIGAGGRVLHPGDQAIFTQTGSYNFDSSDENNGGDSPGSPSSAKPVIHFFLNGSPTDFTDSGQVLNTGGFDLAAFPAVSPNGDGNEALNWRDIGTTGINDPAGTGDAPEPCSLSLLGLGGLPLLRRLRRRQPAA